MRSSRVEPWTVGVVRYEAGCCSLPKQAVSRCLWHVDFEGLAQRTHAGAAGAWHSSECEEKNMARFSTVTRCFSSSSMGRRVQRRWRAGIRAQGDAAALALRLQQLLAEREEACRVVLADWSLKHSEAVSLGFAIGLNPFKCLSW